MRDWLQALRDTLRASGEPVVRVVVATVRGSAPREPGACMLVSFIGENGTIGGGHLELVATRAARDLLGAILDTPRVDRFSLGASLGQCCGGIVELWFERYDAADLPFLERALQARESGTATVLAGQRLLTHAEALREGASHLGTHDAVLVAGASGPVLYENIRPRDTDLWIFGAGHVGRALVHVLSPLPFAITWIDSREDKLPGDLPGNVRGRQAPDPSGEVRDMAAGAWALVMTHSHEEDFDICRALLGRRDLGWIGLIGSAPKAVRFSQRLRSRGFSAHDIARLVTPIGIAGITGKEPAAIAVAVAAQLLQLREARRTESLGHAGTASP